MQPARPAKYFFDDEVKNAGFQFVKPDARHVKEFQKPALLISRIICKALATNSIDACFFSLYDTLLAQHADGQDSAPTTVMDITWARVNWEKSKESDLFFSLNITKNDVSYELRFTDKNVYDNWLSALRKICILPSFHEDYKAKKMIGKGGFAKVFLVEELATNRKYACKAFAKERIGGASKTNPRGTMLNEINIMRALDHPNIIKLHEVHETENSIYLIMELIEGQPLQDPLADFTFRKTKTSKQVKHIFQGIVDAIAYLGSKGIMHRDLKPDNILVDKQGNSKIIDFGLSTYIDIPEYIFKKCGTPGYIAPEVFYYDAKIPKTNYNDKCDVFSAGCILFYMLFGFPFFEGTYASEVLGLNKEYTENQAALIVDTEIANPKSKLNKEGLHLISLMMEPNPRLRVSSSQTLIHEYFTDCTETTPIRSALRLQISRNNTFDTFGVEQDQSLVQNADDSHQLSLKSIISEKGRPFMPSKERFTIKNSMYLDVGRPDLNGKIDSISNASGTTQNSICFRPDILSPGTPSGVFFPSTFSNNTLSPEKNSRFFNFDMKSATQGNENSLSPLTPKTEVKKSFSFRSNIPQSKTHTFLKAAIFNNMKNSDLITDDNSKEMKLNYKHARRASRRHSDGIPKMNELSESQEIPDETHSANGDDNKGLDSFSSTSDDEMHHVEDEENAVEKNIKRTNSMNPLLFKNNHQQLSNNRKLVQNK